jgi:tetratricopeptide (TPR) repeat protein
VTAVADVSLCLIVRDEEDMLPGFLEACAGLWDELVAVDGGSTDRTRELLLAAGARVIDRPWTGDFAAARNASLAAATGRWILVLDPDERPGPGFADELRALVGEPEVGAATLVMRNLFAHGHTRDVPLLRLFRRAPGLRYEHAIHEDAFASVQAMLRADGLELAALHTPVEHLGYLPERARARGKKERDGDALRACIAADPDDLYGHFKLLELARFWSDPAMAKEVAPAAADALRRAGPLCPEAPWGGELVVLLARALTEEVGDALAFADGLADLVEPSAALHLARGEWLEELGELDDAADAFDACLEIGEDPTAQLVVTRPLLGLARVALAQGELEEALEDVDAALATAPRDPEALLAALSLRTGPDRKALAASLRAQHGATPELLRAEGEAALLAGDYADAIAPLLELVGAPLRGRSAIRLAQAQLLSGDASAAEATLEAALAELPEAGIGLLVCDALARRARELELDLDQPRADAALIAWLQLLEGTPTLLTAFARGAGPLLPTFPWLADVLR